MCYPVRCPECGKITWAGCGSHVDAVRASVPADRWCTGHPDSKASHNDLGGWFAGRR